MKVSTRCTTPGNVMRVECRCLIYATLLNVSAIKSFVKDDDIIIYRRGADLGEVQIDTRLRT